jgi:hypothetical protein
MIKRVLFTSLFAAQFLAISAMTSINLQAEATSVDTNTCDPIPCPDCCKPPAVLAQPCDPIPCPDCSLTPPTRA